MILLNITSNPRPEQAGNEQAEMVLSFVEENPHLRDDPQYKEMFDVVDKFKEESKGAEEKKDDGPDPEKTKGDPLDDNGAKIAQMLKAIEEDPEIVNTDPGMKAFKERYDEWMETQKGDGDKAGDKNENPGYDDKKPNTNKEGEDPLKGTTLFGADPKNEEKPEIKSLDDFMKYSQEKYGVNDAGELVGNIDKWKKAAEEFEPIKKKADSFEKVFKEMPEDLNSAVRAWSSGEDYKEVLRTSQTPFDFQKSFEDHDLSQMVNHFFPGKFDKEELKDKEDVAVQKAIDLSKAEFDQMKNKYKARKAEIQDKAVSRVNALKRSVGTAMDKLSESFRIEDKNKSRVQEVLEAGNIDDLFFNSDGSYKEDAARKISLAMYGEKDILAMQQKIKELNEELRNTVSKKSDSPVSRETKSNPTPGMDQTQALGSLVSKKYY